MLLVGADRLLVLLLCLFFLFVFFLEKRVGTFWCGRYWMLILQYRALLTSTYFRLHLLKAQIQLFLWRHHGFCSISAVSSSSQQATNGVPQRAVERGGGWVSLAALMSRRNWNDIVNLGTAQFQVLFHACVCVVCSGRNWGWRWPVQMLGAERVRNQQRQPHTQHG